uniref:Serine protease n=1 Tax=Pyrocoelia rufa TaxID=71223 RepID=Q8IT49_PYRRU|nr:serine protease [Pyrocoelia rufa]
MFKIVLIAALAALAVDARFLSRAPQLDGRIVGGKDTTIEDFPHQVSLQLYGGHACGGSIIASNIILTAAHCTHLRSARIMSIRYGSSIMDDEGTVMDVSEVLQHPSYNPATTDYDISLLILDGSVVLSHKAQIINLVPSKSPEGGRSAFVTGWGAIYSGGPASKQLQVVEVNEEDREACKSAYDGDITERMICFKDAGQDSCQGDSGGPLVSSDGQIGVVSWGYGCADPRYPGVYSHVDNEHLREYIESNVKVHSRK